MRVINTATDDLNALSPRESHNVYCGLDSCVTQEVYAKLVPKLDDETSVIYDFARALQAPVLEMMLRGILTDQYEVDRMIDIYSKRRDWADHIVQTLAKEVWGLPLNPASHVQLKRFFYERMGIPEIYKWVKGEKKLTVDHEALTKIQKYHYARPIASAILTFRSYAKKIGVLRSGIDSDGRMRFSYNIGGTNTGRFSSNKNVFGGGTNGQNITDELRRIFVADKGWKFAYLDLEQAESRFVAYVAGDETYINACESSDLHVYVAKLIWPNLGWVTEGHNLHRDEAARINREIADEKFWRHWSYRDLSKRGGHLTNYVGQAESNAKNLHVSLDVMKNFQSTYLREFNGIRRHFTDVARELQTTSTITTPLGRKRLFFGRNYADDVLRKAVAYRPQSGVGDLLNLGMYRVWKEMRDKCRLLAQLHDAILISYREEHERSVVERARALMTIPIQVTDVRLRNSITRTMIIPVDATVGWNWAKAHPEKNPDGLVSFSGSDTRKRQINPNEDLLKRN